MKIFFPLLEYAPISCIGDLGITISKIIDQLLLKGQEVFISLPFYKTTELPEYDYESLKKLNILGFDYELIKYKKDNLTIFFIKNYDFFSREYTYGYEDDIYRFAFYSACALEIIKSIKDLDLIHICDWHVSILPILLEKNQINIETVLNIYNIRFQGLTNKNILSFLNIEDDYYHSGLLEYYEGVSILKSALILSNTVTFNSKIYFKNIIEHEEKAYGLNGLIKVVESKCKAVCHGIDSSYNPNTDKVIFSNYSTYDLSGKIECKTELQRELSLPIHTEIPLIVIPSLYISEEETWLLNSIIPYLIRMEIQIIILGNKLADFEKNINEMSFRLNCSVTSIEDTDENIRKAFSASDIFLDVSEEAYNDKLIKTALAYGVLPIVINESPDLNIETNKFRIFDFTPDDLINTIKYTINKYYHMEKWDEKVKEVMNYDFSWAKTADEYLNIYSKIKNISV